MLRKQVLCIACAVSVIGPTLSAPVVITEHGHITTAPETAKAIIGQGSELPAYHLPPIDPEDSRTSVSDSKELVQPNVYEDSRSTQGKKDEPTSFGGGNDVGEHGQTQEKLSDQPSDRPVRGASGVGNVIDKPEYLYDEEESGILDRLTFYLFYNLFAKRFWPRYSV
ncbi:hypothetical protein MJO29_004955 [Puccinia striiformis f. sp. tritici]|uniref:Uncharacterized protein n=1 Tax=Puccinia striiformis f. sp. tritici PST-78 TaxID=1165861 RepID=A0A0L0VER1_9BASI|nr:hypothetical protein Pst134EA_009083 [Puccinia striiformis f. sp. tritici]KAI9609501.1 hypothetical protein H4Q26_007458 [Puccinia striiformis f. sp. tritici PST-130]KNE97758.1 hypothetical protein PSTG_08977 [Puccinia striiformis f. sp. tritici PST-78]KAH9457804.1 hypothetical protein Pst134EB_010117 [Puccinia striiformis f. sp. tritici]KAH9468545.1 hypothetical protein Pst134EA_009083 [Puccinia striiformis f. sp. tritici]KAI7959887.1 hypothetical protein MJO29_004955 [Puccinia striiformis